MSRRDPFIDQLEDFLDEHEGPPALPDSVHDAIPVSYTHLTLPTTERV